MERGWTWARTASSREVVFGARSGDGLLAGLKHGALGAFGVLDILQTGTGGGKEWK